MGLNLSNDKLFHFSPLSLSCISYHKRSRKKSIKKCTRGENIRNTARLEATWRTLLEAEKKKRTNMRKRYDTRKNSTFLFLLCFRTSP